METTILHDDKGFYRDVEGVRIDTDINGDWFMSIPSIQYNAAIPDIVKQLIIDNFKILNEINFFSDIYKKIANDGDNVIIKSGIYNAKGYRLTKTTDLEASLTIQLFGFDSIYVYIPNDIFI